jgi:hypothetical protein
MRPLACPVPPSKRSTRRGSWQGRLAELDATHSDIVESPFGLHLDAKDPDNIPIEFFVPAQG